eukprot:TRINITY_DN103531_c0_g1_i1.p1 TRINITY_DN103531_c0_g1~~TRINITY_DN103531_c0_g1_i1.p1  ORF type:complete len:197 (-),score=26.78 TRINITY_DN103531_c0_g1_i1:82-672(-)
MQTADTAGIIASYLSLHDIFFKNKLWMINKMFNNVVCHSGDDVSCIVTTARLKEVWCETECLAKDDQTDGSFARFTTIRLSLLENKPTDIDDGDDSSPMEINGLAVQSAEAISPEKSQLWAILWNVFLSKVDTPNKVLHLQIHGKCRRPQFGQTSRGWYISAADSKEDDPTWFLIKRTSWKGRDALFAAAMHFTPI